MPTRDECGKGQSPPRKRVMIVDDHPIVRRGLAEVINQDPFLEVCGQAEDTTDACRLVEQLLPDLMVVDYQLKTSTGLDLIMTVQVIAPTVAMIMLSIHKEYAYAERAIRAGALGYIAKDEPVDRIITAIHKVLYGEIYVSDQAASFMGGFNSQVQQMSRVLQKDHNSSILDCLSDRELEVFGLIGQGLSTREISEGLMLSIKTIETYRAHIKEKLGCPESSDLLYAAIEWRSCLNPVE